MKHLLNGFKKIAEDAKSTTFRHKNGHEIKIAKKGLSKDMQKKMADLPHYDDGGKVKDTDSADVAGLGFGGGRDPASALTDAAPGSHAPPYDAQAAADSKLNISPDEQAAVNNAPSAPADQKQLAQPSNDPANYSGYTYNLGNQGGSNVGPAPGAMPSAPTPAPVSTEGKKESPQYSGPATTKSSNDPQQPAMFGDYAKNYRAGLGQQEQGIQGQANVGEQSQDQIAQHLEDQANYEYGENGGFDSKIQTTAGKAFQRRDEFKQDVTNHLIQPNHIFQNQDTGSKIATGLGLLLSGMGSGVTGGPNLAYDFLMKQRDADIAAQEKNLNTYQGLYHDNLQDFGNRMDALNMTKVNMNDSLAHRIGAIAASSNSQNAQNIAQQAIGNLHRENAIYMGQMGQGGQGQGGQAQRPEDKILQYQMMKVMSPDEANKAMSQLDDYRNAESAKNNILSASNKIYQEQGLANRVLNPVQSKQQIDNLNLAIDAEGAKALGARYASIKNDMHNLTASFLTNKTTAAQMQNTLNNIFGQHENYSYLTKWGLINQPQTQGPMKQQGQITSFKPKAQ
jgi:hypothetical protein